MLKYALNKCTFDNFTKNPSVTSPDMMLSSSEWSRSPSAHRAKPRRNPRDFIAVRRFAAVGLSAARLLLFAS